MNAVAPGGGGASPGVDRTPDDRPVARDVPTAQAAVDTEQGGLPRTGAAVGIVGLLAGIALGAGLLLRTGARRRALS